MSLTGQENPWPRDLWDVVALSSIEDGRPWNGVAMSVTSSAESCLGEVVVVAVAVVVVVVAVVVVVVRVEVKVEESAQSGSHESSSKVRLLMTMRSVETNRTVEESL